MVTIEDISRELTRRTKDLVEWNYPFAETLEAYYSLFNDTSNKSFSNAGLVLQNSTAVYVQRVDNLWNKTALIRNIIFDCEQAEEAEETEGRRLNRKRNRNIEITSENFRTFNFAEETDKNINIKDSTQESIKSKILCFTQLEKSIVQHIPIDIYDVNGEVIGKKYDFRCNQDISTNGVLVDEFAPEDFNNSDDGSVQETSANSQHSSTAESLEHSSNITVHDSSDKNITSDEEPERNDNDSPEETSDVIELSNSSKNLSNNSDSITDTIHSSTTDNPHDQNATDIANETQCSSLNDTNSPNNIVDSSMLSNNNSIPTIAQSSNNYVGTNMHDGNNQLDSPTKSINSQERTPSMDNSKSLENTNKELHAELLKNLQTICMLQTDSNACLKHIQKCIPQQYDYVTDAESNVLGFRLNAVESCNSTCDENVTLNSLKEKVVDLYSSPIASNLTFSSLNSKSKSQSRRKRTPKTPKKGRIAKKLGKGNAMKNLLSELQKENIEYILKGLSPETDRLSMLRQNLNACMKYIQKYNPLQYDHITNAASDFLGFRLHVVEACDSMRDDAKNNVMVTSIDLDNLDYDESPCSPMSSEHETASDIWLRSDSPDFLPKNIEKWHELLQPKLHEAERRSKYSINHYTSRIIGCLRPNTQFNFNDVIPKNDVSEVARYFLASLELASRQKVNLIRSMDLEHSIQISLYENDTQDPQNEDSHD